MNPLALLKLWILPNSMLASFLQIYHPLYMTLQFNIQINQHRMAYCMKHHNLKPNIDMTSKK
uniref:Uncharacterized protein n=1 Tax=Setaria italica TaxID=4555 RepID=K4AHT6_SETIT